MLLALHPARQTGLLPREIRCVEAIRLFPLDVKEAGLSSIITRENCLWYVKQVLSYHVGCNQSAGAASSRAAVD